MHEGRALRVLYLTHHGPWPPTSGGRLRDAALIPEVARLAQVEVWAISRTPELDESARAAGRPLGTTVRVYRDESRRHNYPTRDSAAARRALLRRMGGDRPFDVVHVEGHYLFHLLPGQARNRAVVVEHNVESHLLRQRAGHRPTPTLAADIEAAARAEEWVWTQAPLTLALSEEDRTRIVRRVPDARVRVSTNGGDHIPLGQPVRPERPADWDGTLRLGFLANYAYPPNRDALCWLLEEIYPLLRRRLPQCRLLLAGSNLTDALAGRPVPPGVEAVGWIDDLSAFWRKTDLVLCPLRVGGGVKVKMIEAIRSGAFVVSTHIGLEGLPPGARAAAVQADSAEAFAEAVARLGEDGELRRLQRIRIEHAQRTLPTWAGVASSLHRHWLRVGCRAPGGVVGR